MQSWDRRLSVNAGPIEFIVRGIGDNILTGSLAVLMWISYVISLSLFAKGFAGYFVPLIGLSDSNVYAYAATEFGVIALFTVLNFFGSKAVGKSEFFIVLVKLGILGVFIVFGLPSINPGYLVPDFSASRIMGMINGAVIFFLSYMGFGLVTNASENIEYR